MAITVIRPSDIGSSMSQDIGKGIGTGLNSLLDQYSQNKMRSLLERQQQQQREQEQKQRYEAFSNIGYSPDQINLLNQLDKKDLFKALSTLIPGDEEQGGIELSPLEQLFSTSNNPKQIHPRNAIERNIVKSLGKNDVSENINQMEPSDRRRTKNAIGKRPPFAGYESPEMIQKRELAERKFEQKEKHFKENLSSKEQLAVDKETLPVYREINQSAKAAKNNDIRLDRMDKLIDKGNLSDARFAAAMNGLEKSPHFGGAFVSGMLKAAFYHPDAQEFEKLTNDFLKDAKEIFGSRLTNFDVESFLKTVPSLIQTDVGKKRVIRNLRLLNDVSRRRQEVMDNIIEENNGRRPRNLESLVERRLSPYLDSMAEEFKIGY
jgi:hypothetical protein